MSANRATHGEEPPVAAVSEPVRRFGGEMLVEEDGERHDPFYFRMGAGGRRSNTS